MNQGLPRTFWICLPFTLLFFAFGVFTIGRNTTLCVVSFVAAAAFTLAANLSVALNRPAGDDDDEEEEEEEED